MKGYLVDTSVWIHFLRTRPAQDAGRITQILDMKIPFGITLTILQEILQGAKSEVEFKRLERYFSTQPIFHTGDQLKSHIKAAQIYFDCRQAGITIRSTIDCQIAQIARENQLILLHEDQDYERIASICSDLRVESNWKTSG